VRAIREVGRFGFLIARDSPQRGKAGALRFLKIAQGIYVRETP
jgi:hypothetical protein